VILENHGIVVGGENLFQAFMSFETLEYCARLEIDARRIGKPKSLSAEDIRLYVDEQKLNMEEFIPGKFSSKERNARRQMCGLIHRAYDQKLFTSSQGTFSQRLDDNSFVITPHAVDRKYLDVSDLVRIENGKREAGKIPSRSVLLHKYIYEQHPDIQSVIIAYPPNIMTFGLVDEKFDSRTIPESYILLRDIPKLPFGSSFMNREKVAEAFAENIPVVMVENDCVIAVGSSLINAFDRLEVAEFSAKAVIESKSIGDIVSIDDEKIADIEKAFNLK
jgi:L-fuculose-phosphate aldolase